jgi:tetratricopeptide (TPR) repeat protein
MVGYCARCSSALLMSWAMALVGPIASPSAQEAYEDVPAWNSVGLNARFEVARSLLEQGEYAAASHELEIALAHGGDPFSLHAMLSTSYLLGGDLKRAKAHLSAAQVIDPENLDLLALQGQFELSLGDPRKGELLLESLVAKQPGTVEAHLLLARSYLQRESVAQAEPHLEALEPIVEGRAATLVKVMRARCYSLRGQLDLALDFAGQAVGEDAAMPEAGREWGLALLQAGRVTEAKPFLERAWRQGPQDPQLAYAMGEMAFRSHHWEAALTYWQQGHRMNPLAYPMAMKWLGLQLATGGAQAAETLVQELARLYPTRVEVALVQAFWARKQGRYAEAAHGLERLSRMPLSQEVRNDMLWEKAQLEFEAGRHKNSMKVVQGLISQGIWVREATLLQARLAFYRSEWHEGERLQGVARGLPVQWPKAGALVAGLSNPSPFKVASRSAP